MIILDTNVVSEPTKAAPDPVVTRWFDQLEPKSLFLTATSLAELLAGIALLPDGRRRAALDTLVRDIVQRTFQERVLAFDEPAAEAYAVVLRRARAKGYALSFPDGQIAAIALVHDFSVATRDIKPYLSAGIPVINPWGVPVP